MYHSCIVLRTDPVDQVSKRSTLEVAAPRLRRRSLEDRKKFYYVIWMGRRLFRSLIHSSAMVTTGLLNTGITVYTCISLKSKSIYFYKEPLYSHFIFILYIFIALLLLPQLPQVAPCILHYTVSNHGYDIEYIPVLYMIWIVYDSGRLNQRPRILWLYIQVVVGPDTLAIKLAIALISWDAWHTHPDFKLHTNVHHNDCGFDTLSTTSITMYRQ